MPEIILKILIEKALCCGAKSRIESNMTPEHFVCSHCGKDYEGGECTAVIKNNYLKRGRTIECGSCHPEKFEDCKKLREEYPDLEPCDCICHQKKEEQDIIKDHTYEFAVTFAEIRSGKNFGKAVEMLDALLEEAREEGYEEGLNLRKEYNDPELLKQIRSQLIKEIEGMKKEVISDKADPFFSEPRAYNQAIDDIKLTLLKT